MHFNLLISYGVILHSLKTHSLEGNHKAFYTYASHITVVILLFLPCIFLYARRNASSPTGKSMMVVSTFISPMLNPSIYTLRNADMKNDMRKFWCRNITLVGRGLYPSCKDVIFIPLQNQGILP